MVKLSDLRSSSWMQIEGLLKAGGEPRRADLAAALERNEPVPAAARHYLASLLRGKAGKRGRRAVPVGEHPASFPIVKKMRQEQREQFLILEVAALAKEKPQEKDPTAAAIKELAARRNLEIATLRRYHAKACARWPEYVATANEI